MSSAGKLSPIAATAPSRIIVRASTDFVVRGVPESVRCLGGIRRATILCAIVAANVHHITRSPDLTWRYAKRGELVPDHERRPVNMNSLAASLALPWETARRHVHGLIEDGLCEKVDGGVIVPARSLTSDQVAPFGLALKESYWRMIRQLKAIGFDFASVACRTQIDGKRLPEPGASPAGQAPEWLLSRVVMEFYLRVIIAGSRAFGGDWSGAAIFGEIMAINGEPFSRDPEGAWLYAYADNPPPDQVRQPASIRETASRLGLPQETVRRQVRALVRDGRVERVEKGYLAGMAFMQSDPVRDGASDLTRAFYRMLHDLEMLGVRF
jgi:hypothetical protein